MFARRLPSWYWNILFVVICFLTFWFTLMRISVTTMKTYRSDESFAPLPAHEVLSSWNQQLVYQAGLPPVAGHRSSDRKFLSIGISSVYRPENYLQQTLESFVNHSTSEERKDVVIIVYLADTDTEKKTLQRKLVQLNFKSHLDSGFIQLIESESTIYPPMDFALTKRTFNDSVDRVIWRTKQVIDFAFLFSYSKNLSDYYLVAEDDIITANDYVSAIRDFIQKKQHLRWVALEFAEFVGIGLLFRNRDLPNLVELLIMFHQYQPVDLLMREYISIQIQEKSETLKRIPSILQHVGKKSTLPNKLQKIVDDSFGVADRKFRNQNPPANLVTTMKVYNGLTPDYSYKVAPGYFWGINEKPEETFDIVFNEAQNISRIVILTGIPTLPKKDTLRDWLKNATLEFSENLVTSKQSSRTCKKFQPVEIFKSGRLDFQSGLVNVWCLRIKVGPLQKSWVIIREIEIFSNRTWMEYSAR